MKIIKKIKSSKFIKKAKCILGFHKKLFRFVRGRPECICIRCRKKLK